MGYEAVDIYALDQRNYPIPLAQIRFFDAFGVQLQTYGATDAEGKVSVLLATGTYTVRAYKFSVAFGAPTTISVEEGEINSFNIYGQVTDGPIPTDTRLCIGYGYFRNETGGAAANVDIHITSVFEPILLDGAAVIPAMTAVRTNEAGYMQVPLIRNGKYNVNIQGLYEVYREVVVPDAPNVNFPDLVFPLVTSVTFDKDPPFEIDIGDELELFPTVYASDGQYVVGTNREDVTWASSDPTVVLAVIESDKIVLQGLKEGTAEISAVRKISMVRIPDPDISGQPITVTVL